MKLICSGNKIKINDKWLKGQDKSIFKKIIFRLWEGVGRGGFP